MGFRIKNGRMSEQYVLSNEEFQKLVTICKNFIVPVDFKPNPKYTTDPVGVFKTHQGVALKTIEDMIEFLNVSGFDSFLPAGALGLNHIRRVYETLGFSFKRKGAARVLPAKQAVIPVEKTVSLECVDKKQLIERVIDGLCTMIAELNKLLHTTSVATAPVTSAVHEELTRVFYAIVGKAGSKVRDLVHSTEPPVLDRLISSAVSNYMAGTPFLSKQIVAEFPDMSATSARRWSFAFAQVRRHHGRKLTVEQDRLPGM
jgi:hypothetical protein